MSRLTNRVPPPSIFVERLSTGGERVTLANGAVIEKNRWGTGALIDGFAVAAKNVREGETIAVTGPCNGATLGGGDPNKAGVAAWLGNEPMRFFVIGTSGESSLKGLEIADNLGGIDVVTFCNLTILCPDGSASNVVVRQGANTGRLRLWNVTLEPESRAAWHGFGSKWPVRAHGHLNGVDGPVAVGGDGKGGGIEMLECTVWPGEEHGIAYVDNVGPSRFQRITRHAAAPPSLVSTRTLIQVTNRRNPAGVTAGGPSGYGPLVFEDLDLAHFRCGTDGSYALTVAGHLGRVKMSGIRLREYMGGGIVLWTDAAPNKGVWLTLDGYSCPAVEFSGIDLESTVNSNPHIAIDGVGTVRFLDEPRIIGQRTAIDIDNNYGGPPKVGRVEFCYSGADRLAGRMKWTNKALTAAQLTALETSP